MPGFASGAMASTGSVGHGVAETTVNATASDAKASVEITPEDADDETPGDQVNLAVGETWPWGRGSCNGTTCDAPQTRERARSPRLCGRPHPVAPGRNRPVWPRGETNPTPTGARVGESAPACWPPSRSFATSATSTASLWVGTARTVPLRSYLSPSSYGYSIPDRRTSLLRLRPPPLLPLRFASRTRCCSRTHATVSGLGCLGPRGCATASIWARSAV